MSGRPNEGRVKLTCYVLEETAQKIDAAVDKTKREKNTKGKIIDAKFQKPKKKTK